MKRNGFFIGNLEFFLWSHGVICFYWYWESSLTNWKRNWSIVWIQLPLFTGESYCWTFKLFDVWLEEKSITHWLKFPEKKSTLSCRTLLFFDANKNISNNWPLQHVTAKASFTVLWPVNIQLTENTLTN